jgi:hypothetical protein
MQMFWRLALQKLESQFQALDPEQDPRLSPDGPLIWVTIANTIFPSATILKQTLKQDLVKLSLAQLDDNYAQYLNKLRSSLLLCPDDHDEQV